MANLSDPAAGLSESGDSPVRFCADLAALLDRRAVSLRVAAGRSGWGKSTIAAARKGPDLPNVDLVLDVLEAIGENEQTRARWRARHERLRDRAAAVSRPAAGDEAEPGAAPVDIEPDPVGRGLEQEAAGADRSARGIETVEGDDGSPGAAASRRWSRRRAVAVAAAVAVLVAGGGGVRWWLTRSDGTAPGRTIVVQNKVAFGPSDLEEDDSPSYLAARPVSRCANIPRCKLPGTDMGSGDTVLAVCQLQGATLTNADVRSPGVGRNPNAAASALWYGVRWSDGRRGYLSEVYVAAAYRGGLQLPPC